MRRLLVLAIALGLPLAMAPVARAQEATPTGGQAVACDVAPRPADEVLALWYGDAKAPDATPLPLPFDIGDATPAARWSESPPEVTLPIGEPADVETAAAVTEVAYEVFACFAAGADLRAFALATDDFLRQRNPSHGMPRAEAEVLLAALGEPGVAEGVEIVSVANVMVLEDGRAAAFVVDRGELGDTVTYAIFERSGDRWLLDEELFFPHAVAPQTFELAPGVTAVAMAFAEGVEVLPLYRITFAPGAGVPPPEKSPNVILLLYVEQGALTYRLPTPITVLRAVAGGGAGGPQTETFAPDTEVTLRAGDAALLRSTTAMGGDVRNGSTEPTSALYAAVVPPGGKKPRPLQTFEVAPGVVGEELAFRDTESGVAEGQREMPQVRLTLEAGVRHELKPDPAIRLVLAVSGPLTLRADAPVTITREGVAGHAGEEAPAGTAVTIARGDYFILPPRAAAEIRNEGGAAAAVVVASLVPSEAPASAEDTPTT